MKHLILITITIILTLGLVPISIQADTLPIVYPHYLNVYFSNYNQSITNPKYVTQRLRYNDKYEPGQFAIYKKVMNHLIKGPTLFEKNSLKLFTPFALSGQSWSCAYTPEPYILAFDARINRLTIYFCGDISIIKDGTPNALINGKSRMITSIVKSLIKPIYNSNAGSVGSVAIYDKGFQCYGMETRNFLNACIPVTKL